MNEISNHLHFYAEMAAKTLLRWNKNYFENLEKHLGEPTEYGDNLKIAWGFEDRKIIYFPKVMIIQLHEKTFHEKLKETRWKLVSVKSYPSEKEIESISNWLKKNAK